MDDDAKTFTFTSFLKRMGPNLAAAIFSAFILGVSATAVAVRDSVHVAQLDRTGLRADLEELRAEFNAFRNPGDRFTASMGAKLEARIERIESVDAAAAEKCNDLRYRVQQLESWNKEFCDRCSLCTRGQAK